MRTLAIVALVGAACTAKPVEVVEGRPAPDHPGELGGAGVRLLEASPRATWVAMCVGPRGVLAVDPALSFEFHSLLGFDEQGRHALIYGERDGVRLVDVAARTATPLPGDHHELGRDGRRLAYVREDAGTKVAVVRELATGEERSYGADAPISHVEIDGGFLYIHTFVWNEAYASERERRRYVNACQRERGSMMGGTGIASTTIVALDEPGTPSVVVPEKGHVLGATWDGWPLFMSGLDGGLRRWTPDGVETLCPGLGFVDAAEVRASGILDMVADEANRATWVRCVGDHVRTIAPVDEATLNNRPAPDMNLFMGATGVGRATEDRWVHLDTGHVVQATPDVQHAYADEARMLLMGERYTLVDPATGAVVHRYTLAARPSVARGHRVGLRGADGTTILDLTRPGWVGRTPGTVVALAEGGHVLLAANPPVDEDHGEATGPFRWYVVD